MAQRLTKGTPLMARTAKEVKNYRGYKRVVPIFLAGIAVLIVLIYVISVMYMRYGSFTVSVNKYHQLKYGLSLCEYQDFRKPVPRLECRAVEDITNIDGRDLSCAKLTEKDGVNSGENYLCYSFYCKNVGSEVLSYDYGIDIANMTLGVEQAVRVRLITSVNGKEISSVDYARAAGVDADGNAIPEPNTVPFASKYMVMQDTMRDVAPDDVAKFTVVIWLEGNDPQCIDNIIGGVFKVDMRFSVVSVADVLV